MTLDEKRDAAERRGFIIGEGEYRAVLDKLNQIGGRLGQGEVPSGQHAPIRQWLDDMVVEYEAKHGPQ